ncbi:Y-box-binding protein 2-A [Portunus trituberculatus]|uniref:Y-box-binding protein 2-A n=1 Tax=Portunus trituberculatus TaxID=210409 RepID=A0A5B7IMQ1_PORTR|nr:Y-box-binding protein 2-A [Portunus trituberculatus]
MAPARPSYHDETTRLADHLPGRVKWYVKAGYGFIENQQTRKDIFVHISGLTRSLIKNPPRKDDEVVFNIYHGEKGPEVRHVVHAHSRSTTEAPELLEVKIFACVYTAKAIAGADHRHLQSLIPILLQHNDLPAIHIPLLALAPPRLVEVKKDDRNNNNSPAERGKPDPKEEKPRNKEESYDDVAGEDEDDEEESEEVDVLGSRSEGEAPTPQPIKPNQPSDPQPPSGKQEEDDGWETKKKRRPRPKAATTTLDPPKVPKHRRTTTLSIALCESPTITRLRQEKRTGKVVKRC